MLEKKSSSNAFLKSLIFDGLNHILSKGSTTAGDVLIPTKFKVNAVDKMTAYFILILCYTCTHANMQKQHIPRNGSFYACKCIMLASQKKPMFL